MIKHTCNLISCILVLFLLAACEQRPETPSYSMLQNRNIGNPELITNAWNVPVTIAEWASTDFFGPDSFELSPDASGGFISTWNNPSTYVQFARRSTTGAPWELQGPDLAKFQTTYSPRLHHNKQSPTVFAIWYSPDAGLNTTFISRFTPDAGWSSPLAFKDTLSGMKIIAGPGGDAVLFWRSFAENGTTELNARYIDVAGNLSLIDTYIFGQPGQFSAGVGRLNGFFTPGGDVELYWLAETIEFPSNAPPVSSVQMWKSTYQVSGRGVNKWAEPQNVSNGSFQLQGAINDFNVIPTGDNDLLVVFNAALTIADFPAKYLEFKAGVWSTLTTILPFLPFNTLVSNVAYNNLGQAAIAWTELSSTEAAPGVSMSESKVYTSLYDKTGGWSVPVQINNSVPQEQATISYGTGDEPVISINASGQVAVAWIDPIEKIKNIYSNYYQPVNGWQGEELAVATTLARESLQKYTIELAGNGDSVLMWQEAEVVAGFDTSIRIKAIDHVGAGNGVVNVKLAAQNTLPEVIASNRYGTRSQHAYPIIRINESSNPQQQLNRYLAEPAPVRLNSAWDEPMLVGEVTVPTPEGRFIDTLHVITNDQGEAIVDFMVDMSFPGSLLWSGHVLNGGWRSEVPALPVGVNDFMINDLVIHPQTEEFFLSWMQQACMELLCNDQYISRRFSDGSWEAAHLFTNSAAFPIDLVTNSQGIAATWVNSFDSLNNPELAFAEFDLATGWALPDLYKPQFIPGVAGTLTHRNISVMASVLGESGTLSLVTDIFDESLSSNAYLLQRDPLAGWQQVAFPLQTPVMSWGNVYLSATGMGNDLHAVVSEGNSSTNLKESSFQLVNNIWSPAEIITEPNKGDIFSNSFNALPKDSNTKGEILVAWNEQVFGNLTTTRQVRVNWYNPDTGWSQPVDIGFPIPGGGPPSIPGFVMRDAIELMRVSINESGEGAVAWVDFSDLQQSINIVHLNSTMTTLQHEIVMTLDPAIAFINALDLHVDNLGRATLVWDEMTLGATDEAHRIKTTTHHSAGSIQPIPPVAPEIPSPTLPTIPDPSPGWSNVSVAWEFPSPNNWTDFSHKTVLAELNDLPVIGIQVDRNYDMVTHQFESSDHIIVSNSLDGIWQEENPFGAHSPDVMTGIQLVTDPLGQTRYALWTSQQTLYINHQTASNVWGQPQSIDSNMISAFLLANSQGHVAVVWQTAANPGMVNLKEISLDVNGTIILSATQSSSLDGTQVLQKPVLNNQGVIVVLRSAQTATNREYLVSFYEFGKSWLAAPSQPLDMNGLVISSLSVMATSNNQMVVFAQSESTRTIHSTFLQPDGTWSSWVNIHSDTTKPVALIGQYRIGTSNNGDLYVMWVEEIIDLNGEPVTNIMFSSFDANGLVNGNPWRLPTFIHQIRHPNHDETPLLRVAQDGSAAIIWKHPLNQGVSAILVKKYNPVSGWSIEHEIVAAFNTIFSVGPTRLNALLTNNNALYIAWETPGDTYFNEPQTISIVRGQL